MLPKRNMRIGPGVVNLTIARGCPLPEEIYLIGMIVERPPPEGDMDSLGYIAPWVLGSVCAGIIAGFFLSRNRAPDPEAKLAEHERRVTLKVLLDLLKSIEQMNGHVECHNSEIRQTAEDVVNLRVSGEMDSVRQALLRQMASVLTSNVRLQNDLVCTRYRMEEQAQEIDEVRREARIDGLTKVANRKAFDEKLLLLLDDWRREGLPCVLILADLDHFKRINDAHGHQAGDRALEMVGQRLKQWVREGDFVGRYGGDEFAVLLPRTELAAGGEIAEMLCRRTADKASRVACRGEQVSVSLSIGVAAARKGDTLESLLQRADRALYRSKQLGRNQVQCEEPPVEEPQASKPDDEALLPSSRG